MTMIESFAFNERPYEQYAKLVHGDLAAFLYKLADMPDRDVFCLALYTRMAADAYRDYKWQVHKLMFNKYLKAMR